MSAHPQLDLSNDELLRTTRAVRKRLNFDRKIEDSVLRECLEVAVQAPTGSNAQGWQFVFVKDAAKKAKIGEYYAQVWNEYKTMPYAIHHLHRGTGNQTLESSQERSTDSAEYLAANIGRAPVLLIPCVAGRTDIPGMGDLLGQASMFGSIIPAAWSFMLAARARGIGSAWTTLHLRHEKAIAELLGIPHQQFMQVALIPLAYTKGTHFKPAYRPPIDTVMHLDKW
ncbi:MAG: nitroreductase family protein [Gammaproteobacteria bacterium]|nr:nitroreductase family protein [Gammaproteobacteria bacterium]